MARSSLIEQMLEYLVNDDAQKAVQAKPMATAEILAKAKATGATMAQIKTKYSVTAEQEKNY